MNYFINFFLWGLIFIVCSGFQSAASEISYQSLSWQLQNNHIPLAAIKVINVFPHDPNSFTQGLVYHQGFLYESTGLYGQSYLRKNKITTGKAIRQRRLDDRYFGEGMAIVDDKIFQLSWKNGTCFVYDLSTFKEIGRFFYSGEGWGLASDGKYLFMSDGSPDIICINPENFTVVRKINVHAGKIPVNNLNELEFIRGEIWANIFTEDIIVRISPATGEVLGWVDLSKLSLVLPSQQKRDVLNGIAYDPEEDRIFVTGKYWPKMFEIKLDN